MLPEQVLTPPEGAFEIRYPSDEEILTAVESCLRHGTSAFGCGRKVWLEVVEESITANIPEVARSVIALAHLGHQECEPSICKKTTETEIIQFAKSQIDNAIEANWTTDLIEWGLI